MNFFCNFSLLPPAQRGEWSWQTTSNEQQTITFSYYLNSWSPCLLCILASCYLAEGVLYMTLNFCRCPNWYDSYPTTKLTTTSIHLCILSRRTSQSLFIFFPFYHILALGVSLFRVSPPLHILSLSNPSTFSAITLTVTNNFPFYFLFSCRVFKIFTYTLFRYLFVCAKTHSPT